MGAEAEFGRRPPQLLCTAAELPELLAINSNLLHQRVGELAKQWQGAPAFSRELFLELHGIVLPDVFAFAGHFRTEFVDVGRHVPPRHHEVEKLVVEMCDYANIAIHDALHTAAFLLWCTNWIHPFYEGNGRVARAVSYLALLVGCGLDELSGTVTIPELIDRKFREEYYSALEECDRAWARDAEVNVRPMESLLSELVVLQAESGT